MTEESETDPPPIPPLDFETFTQRMAESAPSPEQTADSLAFWSLHLLVPLLESEAVINTHLLLPPEAQVAAGRVRADLKRLIAWMREGEGPGEETLLPGAQDVLVMERERLDFTSYYFDLPLDDERSVRFHVMTPLGEVGPIVSANLAFIDRHLGGDAYVKLAKLVGVATSRQGLHLPGSVFLQLAAIDGGSLGSLENTDSIALALNIDCGLEPGSTRAAITARLPDRVADQLVRLGVELGESPSGHWEDVNTKVVFVLDFAGSREYWRRIIDSDELGEGEMVYFARENRPPGRKPPPTPSGEPRPDLGFEQGGGQPAPQPA